MAHITKPRVGETTTTTGTGALALGGALTAHQRFSAVCSVADTVFYDISAVDANGAETGDWEEGLGTYSAANELTRTTVLASSTGSAVSFAAGTKYVRLIAEARQIASIPRGGTSGQVPKKNSSTDYDESWATLAASDVGLGSVTNDAQTKAAIVPNTAPAAGEVLAGNAGGTAYAKVAISGDATLASTGALTIGNSKVTEAKLSIADNTTGNVSTTAHGFAPKAPNDATKYLDGTGAWSAPAGGSSVSVITDTPSTDQNDYAPTGWSTCSTLLLNHSAPIVITGFSAGTAGQRKTVVNMTAELPVLITDEAVTSSSAANRVKVNASGFVRGHAILLPGESVVMEYDGTATRWRIVAGSIGQMIKGWVNRHLRAKPATNVLDPLGLLTGLTGSITSAAIGTGSFRVELARQNHTTTTSAGQSNGQRTTTNCCIIGDAAGRGGFFVRTWFAGSANPADAGSCFIGLLTQTTDIGNNDASSVVNMIGVGTDPTQNALRRMHNDGSGTATANTLGANFAWAAGNCFCSIIFAMPNASNVVGAIWRTDDLSIAPLIWTDTTDIPANTVPLSWQFHVGNRAAAASYGMDLMGADIITPD